jgi:hypothetical protein
MIFRSSRKLDWKCLLFVKNFWRIGPEIFYMSDFRRIRLTFGLQMNLEMQYSQLLYSSACQSPFSVADRDCEWVSLQILCYNVYFFCSTVNMFLGLQISEVFFTVFLKIVNSASLCAHRYHETIFYLSRFSCKETVKRDRDFHFQQFLIWNNALMANNPFAKTLWIFTTES